MSTRSTVVPEQRSKVRPNIRILVQVGHRVEHPWLDGLAAVTEQPHDGAPGQRGERCEVSRIRRERPDNAGNGWRGR